MSKWKPLEIAKKDRLILVRLPDTGCPNVWGFVRIARWSNANNCWYDMSSRRLLMALEWTDLPE